MPGTSAGHFIIEFDGVSAALATEVSGIGIKHTPFKLPIGGQGFPFLGRSNHEPNEITIKHAYALNSTGRELFEWFGDYISGLNAEKRTMRLLQLDENAVSPVAIWEATDVVPTEFMHENNKGDSNDAAYFTIKILPTQCNLVTEG